jgi:hypothetical protein
MQIEADALLPWMLMWNVWNLSCAPWTEHHIPDPLPLQLFHSFGNSMFTSDSVSCGPIPLVVACRTASKKNHTSSPQIDTHKKVTYKNLHPTLGYRLTYTLENQVSPGSCLLHVSSVNQTLVNFSPVASWASFLILSGAVRQVGHTLHWWRHQAQRHSTTCTKTWVVWWKVQLVL